MSRRNSRKTSAKHTTRRVRPHRIRTQHRPSRQVTIYVRMPEHQPTDTTITDQGAGMRAVLATFPPVGIVTPGEQL